MPLFDDDVDSFRSYQFDVHDGANAILTLNESTYQHSFKQILRTNEAQQRIYQKEEKQDAVNDKENVEITISEDLADGQNAKLDASLKLLGEDEQKLLLPSDELDDDEIHIIETNTSATQGGNHALQDYQMQLMLLEQQNKKRLLKARHLIEYEDTQSDQEQAAVREYLREFKGETNAIEVE